MISSQSLGRISLLDSLELRIENSPVMVGTRLTAKLVTGELRPSPDHDAELFSARQPSAFCTEDTHLSLPMKKNCPAHAGTSSPASLTDELILAREWGHLS